MGLKSAVGKDVKGEDFWGREDELRQLRELLHEGQHVSIMAQRRIGKTSLMHETGRGLEGACIVVHVDWQDVATAPDAMFKLALAVRPHEAAWKRLSESFKNFFSSAVNRVESISGYEVEVKLREAITTINWQQKGAQA